MQVRVLVPGETNRYRWEERPGPPAPLPCRHLGAPTGESALCPTCSGRVALKVFGCAIHGKCTQGKAVPGVACCTGCPDHSPGKPLQSLAQPVVRNLLYHIYPLRGGVWRWNILQ